MSRTIEGSMLQTMFAEGAAMLEKNAKRVDALNVFPVPDGDTGTNMNLTIQSGVKEMHNKTTPALNEVAKRFSRGLLMGARGNSGVILSQLFRGFSSGIGEGDSLDGVQLAKAFESGVDTAYRAVMKPVEGTILTVAKDAAKAGRRHSRKNNSADEVLQVTLTEARESLKRTPDLLPVLKEVGVVDSGGQGLVHIYEGMLAALNGESSTDHKAHLPSMEELVYVEHHHDHGDISAEDIEFGYCTEVMVRFDSSKVKETPFDEGEFRSTLSQYGDSLLVVNDEELIKVHIHAEHPGYVMNEAQKYGELIHVKIENMREQHASLSDSHVLKQGSGTEERANQAKAIEPYAIIAVTMGSGIEELFRSIGVDHIIEGGQTMNPSTEQFIETITAANAEHILLLPNNKNIVMTAEQAAEVAETDVRVIPTKSVPQGLGAMFAFQPDADVTENERSMKQGLEAVKSAQVTQAIRDTVIEGTEIKQNDFMGLVENKIVSAGSSVDETLKKVIKELVNEETEMVTIITGEDAEQYCTDLLTEYIHKEYEEVETEVHRGNQPLYHYIIAAE